jgi:hypothetical protein
MDAGEEVSGGLIVAGRNRSVLLELAIEVFHEVARFVQFLVARSQREQILAWLAPSRVPGDARLRHDGRDPTSH